MFRQKNQWKIFIGILMVVVTVVVVLILWYFLKQSSDLNPEHQTDIKGPNVVTMQRSDVNGSKTPPKQANNKPKKAASGFSDEPVSSNPIENSEDSTLSYLDIYRMTRHLEACKNEVYQMIRNPQYDPIHVLQNKLNRLAQPTQVPLQPTQKQTEAILAHHEKCARLIDHIDRLEDHSLLEADANADSTYKHLYNKLHHWLSQSKPKTAKEIAIAQVLMQKSTWYQLFDAVLEVSMGNDSQNREQIAQLNEQAKNIQSQIDDVVALIKTDRDNESLKNTLGDLSQQYYAIDEEIRSLNWVDPVARAQAIEAFNLLNDQLFAHLSSRDPDIFYEAQTTLERNTQPNFFGHKPYKNVGSYKAKVPFVEYVSPGDVVMQILELNDSEVFRLVINHATQLYLCELGADCGPGSTWINYYCFQRYDQIDAASCDQDLASYLSGHLLNDNQWQDVNWVLETVRGLYAR